MDICKISENSNTKTATTPESEEINKIALNAFLVYRLNVHTACIQLLVDTTKALCQRERGDVMSWHSYNSFDDLSSAIDNTWHLSNAKNNSPSICGMFGLKGIKIRRSVRWQLAVKTVNRYLNVTLFTYWLL